ncbi:MAG: formyltransferase family protein [Candidatus Nanohaloarchaea archaeon]
MEIVFLGMNEAGEEVLEWLEARQDVKIEAVVEEEEGLQKIQDLRPELVVSSGFRHIIPEELIQIPEKGVVNLHPSYLPYNRGAHPYIWPLIEDTPAGVSMHFMDEGVDTGPIVARKKVERKPDDTAETLRKRLMREQAELFKQNWDNILRGEASEQGEGTMHRKKDLDEVSRLNLEEEMSLGKAIDLLRGLTYGEKKLATFQKNGETYSVGVEIDKE